MPERIFLPGDRGRWVRRGGSIVLLPNGPDGGELQVPLALARFTSSDARLRFAAPYRPLAGARR